ncbi:PREDICTED: equilibrative nucleoside transporter 3-like [Acropora digitifera]|uniref:equilibrative nucleoside transporter 3-like n=1 Tax=Acropora digitifera TaxID=70779 RepID=UPI00077AA7CE|nr:PREDICTED: equilibrative nucleoside transporter 3-like [Acropora digitifera]
MTRKARSDLETKERLLKKEKTDPPEPVDNLRIMYTLNVNMLLLPYCKNFVFQYFQEKLSGTPWEHSFENYFAIAAMGPNLLMFLLNTLFKHKFSLQVRMLTSVSIMTLCFILTTVLVLIDSTNWRPLFFYVTIGTIIVINSEYINFAVHKLIVVSLQLSLSGYFTLLEQGVGGTFAALANILSLFGGKDAKSSGFGYFMSAVFVLALCLVTYIMLHKLNFARYYILPHGQKKEIKFASIPDEQIERLANWEIPASKKSGNYQHSTLSLDHEALLSVNADQEKEGVVRDAPQAVGIVKNERPPFLFIFKKIAKHGFSVAFVFFITLSIFPALSARIKSTNKEHTEWSNKYFVPVSCFLLFNVGDFAGRLMASFVQWPRRDGIWLTVFCVIRTVFLPLFVFCNALPRKHKHLSYFTEDYYPMVFMGLFAISNGYLGSLCMMYGPT